MARLTICVEEEGWNFHFPRVVMHNPGAPDTEPGISKLAGVGDVSEEGRPLRFPVLTSFC